MIIDNFTNRQMALRAMTFRLIRYMDQKDKNDYFNLALSGGKMIDLLYSMWVSEFANQIEWNRIRFFWTDEKCVSSASVDTHYSLAYESLFKPLSIPANQIFRIHSDVDPGTEAMRYSLLVKEKLPHHGLLPFFDAIILNIGKDAHVASIFSNSLSLLTDTRNYGVSSHPITLENRISMTGPLILNHSPLLIPVLGLDKTELINTLRMGYIPTDPTPATYILSHAIDVTLFASSD